MRYLCQKVFFWHKGAQKFCCGPLHTEGLFLVQELDEA